MVIFQLIGPTCLTGATTQLFNGEFPVKSIFTVTAKEMKAEFKSHGMGAKDSMYKYFIYMIDCDNEVDWERELGNINYLQSVVPRQLIDVYICRVSNEMSSW